MVGELNDTLRILREHGVTKFKNNDFFVVFGERAALEKPIVAFHEAEHKKVAEEFDDEALYYSAE